RHRARRNVRTFERDRRQVAPLHAQQRDIRAWVSSDQGGGKRRPVGEMNSDLALIGKRLVAGHHAIWAPDQTPPPPPPPIHTLPPKGTSRRDGAVLAPTLPMSADRSLRGCSETRSVMTASSDFAVNVRTASHPAYCPDGEATEERQWIVRVSSILKR